MKQKNKNFNTFAHQVVYKEVFITPHNIDGFRSGRLPFVGGEYVCGTNNIIVYRYCIAGDLVLSPDDPIRKKIEYYYKNESATIKHEQKHMDNNKLENMLSLIDNCYELCCIYAIEEVSAYSAEYIHSDTPTHKEVCTAVLSGLVDMMQKQSYYIPRYVKNIQNKCNKTNLHQPIHYSQTFYEIAAQYLTFNGQRLHDARAQMPDCVKSKLTELRNICEQATQQRLKSILGNTK